MISLTMHIKNPNKDAYEGDGWLNYWYVTFCGEYVSGRLIAHKDLEDVTCEECILLDFAYKGSE